MFGVSVTELFMIAVVLLVVVGPHKLPGMLRTLGSSIRKLRIFTTEMRAQTGIDEILREEGIEGGLQELRTLLRGDLRAMAAGTDRRASPPEPDPYASPGPVDRFREYPTEGVDAGGALPDDIVDDAAVDRLEASDRELKG